MWIYIKRFTQRSIPTNNAIRRNFNRKYKKTLDKLKIANLLRTENNVSEEVEN